MFLGGIERESDVKWINLGVFLEPGIRKSSPENFWEFQNFVTFTEEIFNENFSFCRVLCWVILLFIRSVFSTPLTP